jgi:hypothetical protein
MDDMRVNVVPTLAKGAAPKLHHLSEKALSYNGAPRATGMRLAKGVKCHAWTIDKIKSRARKLEPYLL